MIDREHTATLRVLSELSRANGRVTFEERIALKEELAGYRLEGASVDSVLAERVDFDAELRELLTEDSQLHAYAMACALVHLHGEATAEEAALLGRMRAAFGLPEEKPRGALRKLLDDAREVLGSPTPLEPIEDPVEREAAIKERTRKMAVANAIIGALPLPGLDLALLLRNTVKLVRDIARLNNRELKPHAALIHALSWGAALTLKAGVISAMKLSHSAPAACAVCAGIWFASTYASEAAAKRYFADGTQMSADELKAVFERAKGEAEAYFRDNKSDVDAERVRVEATIDTATKDYEAGRITEDEYNKRLDQLIA